MQREREGLKEEHVSRLERFMSFVAGLVECSDVVDTGLLRSVAHELGYDPNHITNESAAVTLMTLVEHEYRKVADAWEHVTNSAREQLEREKEGGRS